MLYRLSDVLVGMGDSNYYGNGSLVTSEIDQKAVSFVMRRRFATAARDSSLRERKRIEL